MSVVTTIPSHDQMKFLKARADDYMYPNEIPMVAIYEGIMHGSECQEIVDHMLTREAYQSPGCNALTREERNPRLSPGLATMDHFIQEANREFWNFDLTLDSTTAWMQEYDPNDDYQLHTDGVPGAMRKLTGVLLLSDPQAYEGGELTIRIAPKSYPTPKTRGTLVVFPAWVLHYVTPVTYGQRHTINMGYFGPNFR